MTRYTGRRVCVSRGLFSSEASIEYEIDKLIKERKAKKRAKGESLLQPLSPASFFWRLYWPTLRSKKDLT
jgi:hypothetical protein